MDSKIISPSLFIDSGDFLDVEFEFIKGDIFSKRVQEEIGCWAIAKNEQYLSIFLTMENQRSNFVMGMNMPDEVYDNEIPLFIRQDRSDNFVSNLREADTKLLDYNRMENGVIVSAKRTAKYAHIYPFGMNESAFSADVKSIKRAKLINYLYSTANYSNHTFKSMLSLEAIPIDILRKEADKMWNRLSVANKWSNMYSSYTIRIKLATLRAMRNLGVDDTTKDLFPLSEYEVEELAKVEHNRWNVEKLLMGFRKPLQKEDHYMAGRNEDAYLLKKNKDLFIHHDIRPYNELNNIKEMDKEFSRYIPWILKMTE